MIHVESRAATAISSLPSPAKSPIAGLAQIRSLPVLNAKMRVPSARYATDATAARDDDVDLAVAVDVGDAGRREPALLTFVGELEAG